MTGMPPSVVMRRLPELVAGFASGAPDLAVSDLSLDSRQLRQGGLFLACRGTRQHGLDFLPQALANGAAALLWEPAPGVAPPAVTSPAIPVEGLSRRVGEIAARFFGHPSAALHVVGVTGTDGKTSTAWLIAGALDALGEPCLYLGTLGSGRVGALLPLLLQLQELIGAVVIVPVEGSLSSAAVVAIGAGARIWERVEVLAVADEHERLAAVLHLLEIPHLVVGQRQRHVCAMSQLGRPLTPLRTLDDLARPESVPLDSFDR